MRPVVVHHEGADGLRADAPTAKLYYGLSAIDGLRLLPDESVHLIATSPPYYGLRNYGTPPQVWGGDPACEHDWGDPIDPVREGGSGVHTADKKRAAPTIEGLHYGQACSKCSAWLGHLGLEPTPRLFVEHLVGVFREARRVLRSDGVLWVNMGDSYSGYHGNARVPDGEAPSNKPGYIENMRASTVGLGGLKEKDLIGIPWMLAFALRDDGWHLRNDIVWSKPAPMPESVQDRCTRAHEYVFHLTKRPRYFYDIDAIREPLGSYSMDALSKTGSGQTGDNFNKQARHEEATSTPPTRGDRADLLNPAGRNRRTVWTVHTKPYPGAHFAVWPEELVEPMVKAGSSEHGCCSACRAPYRRLVERVGEVPATDRRKNLASASAEDGIRLTQGGGTACSTLGAGEGGDVPARMSRTIGWEPTCSCGAAVARCVVLDPFSGSATTGAVAMRLGRDYIGLDLSSEYLTLAEARLRGRVAPAHASDDPLITELFG